MPRAWIEEQLRAARLEVDGAIQLLVVASPDSLDRCAGILETAGQRIAGIQPQLQLASGALVAVTPGNGESTGNAREEAGRLRASVKRARRLLEGAAGLHLNWCRVRDTLCAGYTPRGDPAPPPLRNRISVQG
jgi:hypothetical protein